MRNPLLFIPTHPLNFDQFFNNIKLHTQPSSANRSFLPSLDFAMKRSKNISEGTNSENKVGNEKEVDRRISKTELQQSTYHNYVKKKVKN